MDNGEAMAYAYLAMKKQGIDREQRNNVLSEMVYLFDTMTEEEAKEAWSNSPVID